MQTESSFNSRQRPTDKLQLHFWLKKSRSLLFARALVLVWVVVSGAEYTVRICTTCLGITTRWLCRFVLVIRYVCADVWCVVVAKNKTNDNTKQLLHASFFFFLVLLLLLLLFVLLLLLLRCSGGGGGAFYYYTALYNKLIITTHSNTDAFICCYIIIK